MLDRGARRGLLGPGWKPAPILSACPAASLNADERAFFADTPPWGFILFKRNIENQCKSLILWRQFERSRHGDTAILIDQEGGRVQTSRPAALPVLSAGRSLCAALWGADREGLRAAWLGARLIAQDLHRLDINVDCLPLADVPVAGADAVIGDRAMARMPRRWPTLPWRWRKGCSRAAFCRS